MSHAVSHPVRPVAPAAVSRIAADALILDLDETVCPTADKYIGAVSGFVDCMVATYGVDPSTTRAEFNLLDREAARGPRGILSDRLGASMVRYCRLLAERTGRPLHPGLLDEVAAYGARPFRDPADYTPFPGVVAMLSAYRSAGLRLGLYTKGERAVQMALKITPHGLDRIFDVITVCEAPVKDEAEYRRMRLTLAGPDGTTVSVGDSLMDDIRLGGAAGCRTVWLAEGHAATHTAWNHDAGFEGVAPDAVIARLTDLPTVVALG